MKAVEAGGGMSRNLCETWGCECGLYGGTGMGVVENGCVSSPIGGPRMDAWISHMYASSAATI